jgi:thiol-disulfide isomerase/thioredoxin
MAQRRQSMMAMAAALLSAAGMALAFAPPTDEQIKAIEQAIDTAFETSKGDQRQAESAAKEATKDLDLEQASAKQIEQIKGMGALDLAGLNDRAEARLKVLAADPGIDGARAAGALMQFMPASFFTEKQAEAIPAMVSKMKAALEHPGLGEMVKTNQRLTALESLRMVNAEHAGAFADVVFGLDKHLEPGMPLEPAGSMVTAVMALAEAKDVDPKAREQFRAKLAAVVDQSVSSVSESDPQRARLERRQATINGAFAKGQLIGSPVPAMNITWSNLSGNPQTVADLKGKVVVLDFWATWCGPCIGSFPQVRDLAARYKDYDVVILGVTSLQGNHYSRSLNDPSKRGVVETKDNPKKEYDLMQEFIGDMNITWNVAFTKENVFNPDFGVSGIPHVAIVDAKGVVRYRGMHPGVDPEKKFDMIDGLLKEAGLKTPPPAEKKAEEKAGG